MFLRRADRLPPDITFPANLEKLGYFVTDKDQVRQIRDPERKYQYKINRNDRVNDMYKEAMNTCSRAIVRQRLLDLDLQELPLPLGATPQDKHVPILVSPNLAEKKHVLVIFTERHIDLGILSYRILGEESINAGSIVNLVKTILEGPSPPAGRPGLIITNPSQLIWYRGGSRPVTDREWVNLPRPSAVHSAMRIDETNNRIEGNKNFEEHVEYIFEHILASSDHDKHPAVCNPEAKFSIIGLEYPGSTAVQYIANNWLQWSPRISCMAFCNPQHSLQQLLSQLPESTSENITIKHDITKFIATRTRAYRVSRKPVETPLKGIDPTGTNEFGLGCNLYSSGEALYEESVFVRCWGSILDWIDLCRFSEGFEEPMLFIPEEGEADEWGGSDNGSEKKRAKWPRTEEEIGRARFHGEIMVGEGGGVGNDAVVGENGVASGHDAAEEDVNGAEEGVRKMEMK